MIVALLVTLCAGTDCRTVQVLLPPGVGIVQCMTDAANQQVAALSVAMPGERVARIACGVVTP